MQTLTVNYFGTYCRIYIGLIYSPFLVFLLTRNALSSNQRQNANGLEQLGEYT